VATSSDEPSVARPLGGRGDAADRTGPLALAEPLSTWSAARASRG